MDFSMNENARKWVAALRSGKYKQIKRRLRDKKGFCCLGVACDVYMKATGDGEWTEGRFGAQPEVYEFRVYVHSGVVYEEAVPPSIVAEWLGLRTALGEYSIPSSLGGDNEAGKNFVEIADIIESEPDGLFHE